MGQDLLSAERESESLSFTDVKLSASSSSVIGSSFGGGIFPQISAVSHSPLDITAESLTEGIAPNCNSSFRSSTLPSSLVAFLSKTELLLHDIRNVRSRTGRKKKTGHEHSVRTKNLQDMDGKVVNYSSCKSSNNERRIRSGGLPNISEDRGRLSRSSKAIHHDSHDASSSQSLKGSRTNTCEHQNQCEQQHLKSTEWMKQKVNDKVHSISSKEFSPSKNISKIDPQKRRLSKLCTDHSDNPNEGSAHPENIPHGHTTNEWQNELARHILSMYATTTAAVDSGKRNSKISPFLSSRFFVTQ